MRKRRNEQVLKRKNFFPTLIVTFFLWLALGALIYFVDPEFFGAVPIFFILIFFVALFTFSLIFAGRKHGLIISASAVIFLTLAYFGIGNVLNLSLIIAIAVCMELYLAKR